MPKIIDGKAIAAQLLERLKAEVETFATRPRLAVILVGNDPASEIYVRNKVSACRKIGVDTIAAHLDEKTNEESLLAVVDGFNQSDAFTGILIQLPLPPQVREKNVIEAIHPVKDVDGFHPLNIGRMSVRSRDPYLHPCTPFGIMKLIDSVYAKKDDEGRLRGKRCVVIGQSHIVGRPVSIMLQNLGATVIMCDEFTKDLAAEVRGADMIITATGVHGLVNKAIVAATGNPKLTVIDAGITKVDGRVVGDCDPAIYPHVGAYTPVPGGVGPMTIAYLMKNVVKAYKIQNC